MADIDFDINITMTCCGSRYATITETMDHVCPTEEATKEEAPIVQTGTIGRSNIVHEITEGHAICGASYRRGRLGNSRVTLLKGQHEITCERCKK